jgi:hypothetical protein
MSKQYNIKWREQDEKELRRVVRNFNDKLRRLVKENPENKNILPQFWNEQTQQFESRVVVKNLKELIQTRADYNRQLNMLKRFGRRGAEDIIEAPTNEYGARTTKWQKSEMARMAQIVNRRRKERLENLENVKMLDSYGELGYTLGQRFGMGLASRNSLNPIKTFTRSQTQADLKQKVRALMRESASNYAKDRDLMLKENFINELRQNYNEADISDVIERIRSMDDDLFVLKFEARGDKFELAYPPDRGSDEYKNYVSELKGYWLRETTPLDVSTPLLTTILNQ